ncbi:MAG: sigma-70 family RNA polymerase sigma factor [Patescibacteria group bacterium]|nr:sigma-70 family RNA polymerase sigma factor [Patescibacteria group bacterium]
MDSEQQLIEAAKSDKTEFVKLYDKYFDQIYKYMLTRVADVQLAEDLTSQTFLIALEKIDGYKWTGKPFSAWLYRVAINEMNQHYRKAKKNREVAMREWQEAGEKFDPADTNLKESENREEETANLRVLNQAIQKLKPGDQDILSLKFFENLSYKEIAGTLGISVSNVGVKLNRATDRLAKICNI